MAPSLPPTSGIDLLSAAHRDTIVASELREYLPSLGLHEVAPRRWIDGSRPPVRRLFELRLLKGAAMTPWWGFSLDFVPHISGGALRWHRSDRTAMLDVIINPAGLVQPSFLHGARRLTDDLRELLAEIVPAIERTWLRGSSDAGMLEIMHGLKEHGGNCHRYENYTQLPLAHAFLAAKMGRTPPRHAVQVPVPRGTVVSQISSNDQRRNRPSSGNRIIRIVVGCRVSAPAWDGLVVDDCVGVLFRVVKTQAADREIDDFTTVPRSRPT